MVVAGSGTPDRERSVSLLVRITGFVKGSKTPHTPIRCIQTSHGNHQAHKSVAAGHLRVITRGQPSFGTRPPGSSRAEKWELFPRGSFYVPTGDWRACEKVMQLCFVRQSPQSHSSKSQAGSIGRATVTTQAGVTGRNGLRRER